MNPRDDLAWRIRPAPVAPADRSDDLLVLAQRLDRDAAAVIPAVRIVCSRSAWVAMPPPEYRRHGSSPGGPARWPRILRTTAMPLSPRPNGNAGQPLAKAGQPGSRAAGQPGDNEDQKCLGHSICRGAVNLGTTTTQPLSILGEDLNASTSRVALVCRDLTYAGAPSGGNGQLVAARSKDLSW
ncbi:hypothetical protein [Kribbella endophytica]